MCSVISQLGFHLPVVLGMNATICPASVIDNAAACCHWQQAQPATPQQLQGAAVSIAIAASATLGCMYWLNMTLASAQLQCLHLHCVQIHSQLTTQLLNQHAPAPLTPSPTSVSSITTCYLHGARPMCSAVTTLLWLLHSMGGQQRVLLVAGLPAQNLHARTLCQSR